MHQLSEKTDLSFLKEKQLEMLCFAAYSLYLHFGKGVIITIEGVFEHVVSGDKKRAKQYSFPIGASGLMRLLAEHVRNFKLGPDASLRLEFSNGDVLTIRGEDGPYESYQIQHNGAQIVV